MTFLKKYKQESSGFTLIEIVIGLIIVGLIIGSIAGGLKIYYQQVKLETTKSRQEQIEAALFAHIRQRSTLPCPAPIGIGPDDPRYGRSDNCAAAPNGTIRVAGRDGLLVRIGAFPARDFELPDRVMEDSWGHLFTYAVTESLANAQTFMPLEADFTTEAVSPDIPVDLRYATPEISSANFALMGERAVIRSGRNLYLVTNTATADEADDSFILVENYFGLGDLPDIWIKNPADINTPIVFTAMQIQANIFDNDLRLYESAAIEIKTLDGNTLSPPHPVTGVVEEGHNSFIIISHGQLGIGGYTVAGVQTGECAAGAGGDLENCDMDAEFVAANGFSLGATGEYYDDVVSYAATLSGTDLLPHQACEADGDTSNGNDGFQLLNPDGSWGVCLNLRGPQGPIGPRGATGPAGPGVAGGMCADGFVLQGFEDSGTPKCVVSGGGGGAGPSNVHCAPGTVVTGFNASGNPVCSPGTVQAQLIKQNLSGSSGTVSVNFNFAPDVVLINPVRISGTESDSNWIIEQGESVDALFADYGSQSMRINQPRLNGKTLTFGWVIHGAGAPQFRLLGYAGVVSP